MPISGCLVHLVANRPRGVLLKRWKAIDYLLPAQQASVQGDQTTCRRTLNFRLSKLWPDGKAGPAECAELLEWSQVRLVSLRNSGIWYRFPMVENSESKRNRVVHTARLLQVA
jgi:hypothetical protein